MVIHTAPYNAIHEQKPSSCNLKRNVNSDLSTYQTQLNPNTDRHGFSLIIETMPKYWGNYNLVQRMIYLTRSKKLLNTVTTLVKVQFFLLKSDRSEHVWNVLSVRRSEKVCRCVSNESTIQVSYIFCTKERWDLENRREKRINFFEGLLSVKSTLPLFPHYCYQGPCASLRSDY